MIGEKDILLKKQAIEKATKEYRKYQVQNLSPVEEEYLASIKNIQSIVKKKEIIDKTEQIVTRIWFIIIRGINGTELVELVLKYYKDLNEKHRFPKPAHTISEVVV